MERRFTSESHPIHWFRDKYREAKLTLKPPYQRNPVWAARQKSFLIESVLLEVPIPEIYIHQVALQQSAGAAPVPVQMQEFGYAVVDGQQRIRTVLQFLGFESDPEEAEFLDFKLDKLDATSPWFGMGFTGLSPDDRQKFLQYPFQCRVLHTDDEHQIRQMFARLNKYQMALKPQELRNATYQGPFARLSAQMADDPFWDDNRMFTKAVLRRMADVEFVSELLIGILHGPQGGSAKAIDAYYVQYEDYEDEFPEQRDAQNAYKHALDKISTLFPRLNDSNTRWRNRADFYSLFVLIGSKYRSGSVLPATRIASVRRALGEFGDQVTKRLTEPKAKVSKEAVAYARAVEKGVNDRHRRAVRHESLEILLTEYFKESTS